MNDVQYANLVCFVQGAQAMLNLARCYSFALAQAQRAAQPTPASELATRREMGRSGLAPLLSSRPRLTAAHRREVEAAETAKRLGIYRGSVQP